jgi:hypothetical protein
VHQVQPERVVDEDARVGRVVHLRGQPLRGRPVGGVGVGGDGDAVALVPVGNDIGAGGERESGRERVPA